MLKPARPAVRTWYPAGCCHCRCTYVSQSHHVEFAERPDHGRSSAVDTQKHPHYMTQQILQVRVINYIRNTAWAYQFRSVSSQRQGGKTTTERPSNGASLHSHHSWSPTLVWHAHYGYPPKDSTTLTISHTRTENSNFLDLIPGNEQYRSICANTLYLCSKTSAILKVEVLFSLPLH